MYKADDITEETEEIVLKRARDSVEKAKFMVEYAKLNHDQALKFAIPRMEVTVKESARRKSLDWEKNKVELPLAVQKQRLELEKLRMQRERSDEKLKKLLADREADDRQVADRRHRVLRQVRARAVQRFDQPGRQSPPPTARSCRTRW